MNTTFVEVLNELKKTVYTYTDKAKVDFARDIDQDATDRIRGQNLFTKYLELKNEHRIKEA